MPNSTYPALAVEASFDILRLEDAFVAELLFWIMTWLQPAVVEAKDPIMPVSEYPSTSPIVATLLASQQRDLSEGYVQNTDLVLAAKEILNTEH